MGKFGDMISGVMGGLKGVFGNPKKFNASDWTPIDFEGVEIPNRVMDRVRRAYNNMDTFRKNHFSGAQQFLARYVDGGSDGLGGEKPKEVIINLIRKMVTIYMRLLASGTPQVDITTRFEELMGFADNLEAALNRHLLEINIGGPMQGAVWNAMFSVGCLKTGIAEGDLEDQFEFEGETYDIGRAFSESIVPNNLVVDVQASSRFNMDFIGDRYLRPRYWVDEMRKSENRDRAGIEDRAMSRMVPTDRISGVTEGNNERLYDDVWCWDIYLPKQNIMVTFLDGEEVPIAAFQWEGPEGYAGPYRLVGFNWVDGEVLPAAPVPALEPLHRLVNSSVRKLAKQAHRQKEVYTYPRHASADADAVRKANDGEFVGISDPQAVQSVKFGGPDAVIQQFSIWAENEFDDLGGSLSVLAGSQPMSETVGQDQLLHESANALVNAMRREVREAMKAVIFQHAWYVWTDPVRSYQGDKKIPGLDDTIPITIDPEVREGDFLQYNFDVRPYSLTDVTPAEEAAHLRKFLMEDLMPNAQMLMQLGKLPNVPEILETIARLTNVPIESLWIDMEGAPSGKDEQGMIPVPQAFKRSETVNTRVSKPGTTQGSKRNEMVKALGALAQSNQ